MHLRSLRSVAILGTLVVLCGCDEKKEEKKDASISQDMVRAIVQDKPGEVKDLLDKGESLDARQNGQTALHIAAMNGKVDIVTILIARGANVNIQDDQGVTPLMLASKTGKVDAVKALIAQGAKLEAQDKLGENALHIAAANGKKDVVEVLLDRGANIRSTTNTGLNALVFALNRIQQDGATKTDTELVQFIKSKYGTGADTVKPTIQAYVPPDEGKPAKKAKK
jgi:ankyrin repeat protein